ncbi:hypothetical protein [Nonlabens spongiae]|nr:hypothetical protein [Nonlabens spongiae]
MKTFPLIKSLLEKYEAENPEYYDSDLALIYYNIGDYDNARKVLKNS